MVETTHDNNTSVSSVAIYPISNGIAPSIPVEPATKLHPDTHHEHIKDMFTTMESVAIMILRRV
jgi:hypothetical protein